MRSGADCTAGEEEEAGASTVTDEDAKCPEASPVPAVLGAAGAEGEGGGIGLGDSGNADAATSEQGRGQEAEEQETVKVEVETEDPVTVKVKAEEANAVEKASTALFVPLLLSFSDRLIDPGPVPRGSCNCR